MRRKGARTAVDGCPKCHGYFIREGHQPAFSEVCPALSTMTCVSFRRQQAEGPIRFQQSRCGRVVSTVRSDGIASGYWRAPRSGQQWFAFNPARRRRPCIHPRPQPSFFLAKGPSCGEFGLRCGDEVAPSRGLALFSPPRPGESVTHCWRWYKISFGRGAEKGRGP